jgi:hypothetical protein
MDNDDFNEEQTIINYEQVVKSTRLLATTRMFAKKIMDNPYLTVKDFLIDLSDRDLEFFINLLDGIDEEETDPENFDPALEDLLLISMMLRQAEGLDPVTGPDDAHESIKRLSVFLILESLYRKGMVELFRENMSMGDDYNDKMVVKKLF